MSAAGSARSHASDEQLRRYALGLLSQAQSRRVETHLSGCAGCRAVVAARQADLVRAVETLPAPGPLPPLRAAPTPFSQPARPSHWPLTASVAALALAVLALATLSWNAQPSAARSDLQGERQLISGWLSRPDVRLVALSDVHKRPAGQVLISAAGQALFVLPAAPAGLEYRAWVARDWHLGEPMMLARQSRGGAFVVSLGDNDYICLSLDRPDASRAGPTHILGKAFL